MTDARILYALEPLLALIRKTETGKADPAAYDVVYGGIPAVFRPGYKPPAEGETARYPASLSDMMVGEVLGWQADMRKRGADSTAAGAYQFIYPTLKRISFGRHLVFAPFDKATQDELAVELIGSERAVAYFSGGDMGTFARYLATQWASFPVLAATKGAKRAVSRGQSYYAGDGLNKALITPAIVEGTLIMCKTRYLNYKEPVAPAPKQDFLTVLLSAFANLFARKK